MHNDNIQKNRDILKWLIDVVFPGRQELPFHNFQLANTFWSGLAPDTGIFKKLKLPE